MNIYILEDSQEQQEHLTMMIRQLGKELGIDSLAVHTFSSTDKLKFALPLASKQNVFILDLEIDGNPQAGLVFSQTIRKYDSLASIIFITVHDELLYTTYKTRVRALDFIAKDQGDIYQELKKDLHYIQDEIETVHNQPQFKYKSYSKDVSVPLDQICYFQSNVENSHSSIMVTTDNQHVQINYNLRSLQKMDSHFFRAHRSYLVNPRQIKHINILTHTITFRNGLTCSVSRRHVKKLLKIVQL